MLVLVLGPDLGPVPALELALDFVLDGVYRVGHDVRQQLLEVHESPGENKHTKWVRACVRGCVCVCA